MLSRHLEISMRFAMTIAKQNLHEYLTVEHLLLALLENNDVVTTLKECGADITPIKFELDEYINQHTPIFDEGDVVAPQPSQAFDRILQRAIFHVQSTGDGRLVEGSDILVSMFSEHDTFAIYTLKKQEVTRLKLTEYLSHGLDRTQDNVTASISNDNTTKQKAEKSPLSEFTTNLNEQAKQGKTDPLIGRSDEINRTAQVLCRRRKNNPLLVGEPGVGKTSIAEGLAWLIVNNEAPKPLENCILYSLDIGALVAGTKYRGDFEKRMKSLLTEIKNQPNAILFIDEIHMIIGAGSSMSSNMDTSNLIKPALANGDLRCIGSTTFTEYRQVFEKDPALSRRFQKINIEEPNTQDTIDILRGLKSKYEEFHNVEYSDKALVSAVKLSVKHIHERFLPDKAIDVIDEAGAYQRLNSNINNSDITPVNIDNEADKSLDKASVIDAIDDPTIKNEPELSGQEQTKKALIDVAEIEEIIAKLARIPSKSVSNDDKSLLKNLDRDLKHLVFGQNEAIDTLSDAIKLSRAGLKSADKPIGSFMFAGPTGVGKTEVSKQLAKLLGIELIRFDMSEYMESHTASRLIGAPPGYVGYDQGGLLTEKINQHPHCVLLLDEVEKAHTDVFNLLLQVMDHGSLTDNNGRVASFKQVIVIMTTNVGADSISRSSMGFTEQDHSKDNNDAMKRMFTPEFRNRLDATIHFNPLDSSIIVSVVDKFLVALQAQLDDKKVTLEINNDVREYLADKGYDRLMGARPMERLIQNEIKKPLSSLILFGALLNGGTVNLHLRKPDQNIEESDTTVTTKDSRIVLTVTESYATEIVCN